MGEGGNHGWSIDKRILSLLSAAGLLAIYIVLANLVGSYPSFTENTLANVAPRDKDIDRLIKETTYRGTWIIAATAFVVLSGAIAVRACSLDRIFASSDGKDQTQSSPPNGKAHTRLTIFWCLTGLLALVCTLIAFKLEPIGAFDRFFEYVEASPSNGEDGSVSVHAIPRGAFVLSAIPIAHFAFACGTIRKQALPELTRGRKSQLIAELDSVLQIGSLLLVVGTLMTYALWSWGFATLDWTAQAAGAAEEATATEQAALASAAGAIPGLAAGLGALLWSTLLAMLYLPARRDVMTAKIKKPDAQQAATDNASPSPEDPLGWTKILAIIAPILASLGVPLIEELIGAIN
ncbi:MAG: hypothetical protein AAFO89_07355 [Planctomycetota bacterium]